MSCHNIGFSLPFCLFVCLGIISRSYTAQTWWVGEVLANLDFVSYFVVSLYNIGVPLS